jgi:hypothetical protein
LALDDKYDDIKKLIDAGKEKGYLTYDQVNDLIPHDVHSPEDLEDLLTTIGTQGIDVLESSKGPTTDMEKKFEEVDDASEDVELDLTPGALEKTNDPVRMYLREMGTVPLLTREGEVEIAKRIERGQNRVLKALSRSPIVIRELLALGEDLEKGVRSIKELVTFDEEEITEEIVDKRLKEFLAKIATLDKLYKKVAPLQEAPARPSAIPLSTSACDCADVDRSAQARFHQQRTQTPHRPRQSHRRRHALARPADPESGKAGRCDPQRRTKEGIQEAVARGSRRAGKA